MAKFPALIPIEAARSAPIPPGRRSPEMMRHGSLEARFYAPRGSDPQTPHDRDEVYVVVSGTGWFRRGDERHHFKPGDFLFVPAHVEHRFEDFSDDLELWVMFYGPEGGETP
jgi:mannose-6-phosphate isomerase-like protein (cupin superfamily)